MSRFRNHLVVPEKVFVSFANGVRGSPRLSEQYTESQVEQAFNAAMFVEILEYMPVGSGTAHIVPKRTGATGRDTPDVVLGMFPSRGGALAGSL